MNENQNQLPNQTSQSSSPINWERLEALMASVWEQSKETDRRMQETDRRMQETDRLIKELRESQKETEKLVEKTTQSVDSLSKKYSKFGDEWGRFLEEMCVPATIDIFKKEGINITQRYTGVTHASNDDGDEMEVDVILCNTTEAVAIEVKSSCTQENIDHFVDKMQSFKKIFHPFDKYDVYAAIVGMKFQNGVEKYACSRGLYVIKCSAEGVFKLSARPNSKMRLCYKGIG